LEYVLRDDGVGWESLRGLQEEVRAAEDGAADAIEERKRRKQEKRSKCWVNCNCAIWPPFSGGVFHPNCGVVTTSCLAQVI
jgi:hypothetical protein